MPPVARSYSVEPTLASVGLAAPGRPRIERRCSLVVAVTVAVTVTVAVVVVVVVAMSPVALLGSPAVSWGVDQGRVVAGGTGPGPAGVPAADGPADRSMGQGPASCRRPWVAPVDAAVVDPFRPPAGPYGPGNRGLEYGTELGQAVVAVADGTVRFAAPVGGAPVVVIDHGGGLVSTYVRLLEGSVARADRVVAGTPVAVADVGFHLTARLDGRYIDPAALLDRTCIVVRLVVPPESGRR